MKLEVETMPNKMQIDHAFAALQHGVCTDRWAQ